MATTKDVAIMTKKNKPKVLAIASGGGHWVQLWRLRPAWENCDITYVTTSESRYKDIVKSLPRNNCKQNCYYVIDANRWEKLKLIKQLIQIVFILIKERPQVIISTGAAPGFFALRFGKVIGARTIWIDSIANAATLSLSGKKIQPYADLCLTQWEHLSGTGKEKPLYKGSVI